jgi:O-antigen ligase
MPSMSHATDTNEPVPLGIMFLGLAPVIMVLLPWDFGTDSTEYRAFMRVNSLPGTMVEFMFVFLAFARGFAPAAAILSLPWPSKIGLLILAIGAVWTTIFVAVVPMMAVLGLIKFFAHVMFGLAMAHQLTVWTAEQRKYIWPAIGLGVVGYCVLWGVNIAFYHPVGNDWIRLVPAVTNIRWVGFFALAGYCAGIGLLAAHSDNHTSRLSLLCGIFFSTTGLAIAFFGGVRAAFIAILVAAVLSSIVLPIRKKLLALTLISTIIALAVVAALPLVHPWYGIERMIGTISRADASSGRIDIWIDVIDKIMHRPIMGWGVDQFRYSFPVGTPFVRQPHEGILQLVFSSGLLGVLAALLIAIPFARKAYRKFTRPYEFASIAYIFGACVYGLYDGLFYYSYPVMILLAAACCIAAPIPSPAASNMAE